MRVTEKSRVCGSFSFTAIALISITPFHIV